MGMIVITVLPWVLVAEKNCTVLGEPMKHPQPGYSAEELSQSRPESVCFHESTKLWKKKVRNRSRTAMDRSNKRTQNVLPAATSHVSSLRQSCTYKHGFSCQAARPRRDSHPHVDSERIIRSNTILYSVLLLLRGNTQSAAPHTRTTVSTKYVLVDTIST